MGTPPPEDYPTKPVPGSGRVPPAANVDTLKPASTGVPGPGGVSAGNLPEQFGRYRIAKKLGEGSMGSVYLAHDLQLDRPVALKVPRIAPQDDPKVLERFHREARAAALFRHTNLCPVYDVGEHGGVHYLTMAYVDGAPLSVRMRQGPAFTAAQAAALVRQLALALAYAHEHGVVHRDLKPSNIMMTAGGEPVIMDFGLARRADGEAIRLTQTGDIMGTPTYMPPEQVTGDLAAIGPVSDVYSLGVILYELLTGRLPFPGTLAHILAQIITQEPPPPVKVKPDLDRRLSDICMKAMAKKGENRYPNMQAFAEALEQWLLTVEPGSLRGSTTLTHVSGVRRPDASPRRSVALALVGILLLVCVIAGAAFFGIVSFLGSRSSTASKTDAPAPKVDGPSVPVAPPVAPPPAFRELFNGKDLAGWVPDNTTAADWPVEDRTITAKGTGAATSGWLLTERAYEDFALRFEFRLGKGAKSGIALRAEPGDRINGLSYHMKTQIFDDGNPSFPNAPTGSLLWCDDSRTYLNAEKLGNLKPAGDWNEMEVIMRGQSLRALLNGKPVLAVNLDDYANRPGALPALRRKGGRVGLQKHTGQVWFRNIGIREIPRDATPPRPSDGFEPLLSGKAIAGWEGINAYWRFEDGMLIGKLPAQKLPSNTFFCTKKPYRDFELRFQVRLKGGNSGLQIRSKIVDEDRYNVHGPQVEIGHMGTNKYHWGSLVTEPVVQPSVPAPMQVVNDVLRKDDFNDFYVKCVGKHITVKLNGATTVDEDFPSMPDSGILALQLHHYFPEMEVAFRSFELKELGETREQAFHPLFYGKDLSGWVVDSGDPEAWSVRDGSLCMNATPRGDGWLMTRDEFSDFVLRFETQLGKRANTGVALRAAPGDGLSFAAAKGGLLNLEVQLWDDSDAFYGRQSILQQSGALYSLALDRVASLKPLDEWNEVEIAVKGREVTNTINGQTVLKANLDHYSDRAKKIPGLRRPAGRIGLQNHTGSAKFRNIQIKELDGGRASLPADDRFEPMFNGLDFAGWSVDHGDARAWTVERGMVIASGAAAPEDRGWLLTRQDYDNFILRLEFNLARGGNSGITFRAAPGESRFLAPPAKRHAEIQVFDDTDPTWADKLLPAQTTGALYNVTRSAAARLKPIGEWNTMEVMAWGRYLFVAVNGYPTLDVDLDDFADQAESLPGLKRTSGRIGLQNWQGTVQYRNVQIRRLPAP